MSRSLAVRVYNALIKLQQNVKTANEASRHFDATEERNAANRAMEEFDLALRDYVKAITANNDNQ